MELLVTGAFAEAKQHIEELEEKGHRVHFLQFEKDGLPCPPDQIEGVICNGLFLYHAIEKFPRLRFIQLTSSGFDRVPLEYVRSHGIAIYNARGVYSIPMAEYAVAGVLNLYKGMYRFRDNQKRHRWEKRRDLLEISGKTVCVFGCGSVGQECAKRFAAFGAYVIGVDVDTEPREWFEEVYALDRIDSVVAVGDIIISALPLTAETRHFFHADIFDRMKHTAVFVNLSRGMTVKTEDLIRTLKEGRLFGAVLDVFEEEPLQEGAELWDMENVVITPHNSFVGEGNQERLWKIIRDNPVFCSEGELNVVLSENDP